MARKGDVGRGDLAGREAGSLAGRRRFLAGAGKLGALVMGAAYLPAYAAAQGRGGRGGGGAGGGEGGGASEPEPTGDEVPVAVKGVVRLLGVSQRRPGLTRAEAPFADSPHIVPAYYATVYAVLTGKKPGQNTASIINSVSDAAFGGDRLPPPGPANLHITVPHPTTPSTTLVNRDMVCETSWQPLLPGGREGGQGWAANMPRWVEPGTEMNLLTEQVFAQGTRPNPVGGGEKAMYFIKMAASVARADQLKTWQALHAKAAAAVPGFAEGLQGYELLQRLPDVAPKTAMKGGGEIALPDVVACYWPKDSIKNFPDYARAFRVADKDKLVELDASFFLLVNEYDGSAR